MENTLKIYLKFFYSSLLRYYMNYNFVRKNFKILLKWNTSLIENVCENIFVQLKTIEKLNSSEKISSISRCNLQERWLHFCSRGMKLMTGIFPNDNFIFFFIIRFFSVQYLYCHCYLNYWNNSNFAFERFLRLANWNYVELQFLVLFLEIVYVLKISYS